MFSCDFAPTIPTATRVGQVCITGIKNSWTITSTRANPPPSLVAALVEMWFCAGAKRRLRWCKIKRCLAVSRIPGWCKIMSETPSKMIQVDKYFGQQCPCVSVTYHVPVSMVFLIASLTQMSAEPCKPTILRKCPKGPFRGPKVGDKATTCGFHWGTLCRPDNNTI